MGLNLGVLFYYPDHLPGCRRVFHTKNQEYFIFFKALTDY